MEWVRNAPGELGDTDLSSQQLTVVLSMVQGSLTHLSWTSEQSRSHPSWCSLHSHYRPAITGNVICQFVLVPSKP